MINVLIAEDNLYYATNLMNYINKKMKILRFVELHKMAKRH